MRDWQIAYLDIYILNRASSIGKLKCHGPAVPIFFWIWVVARELLLLEQNVARRGNVGFIYKLGWELGIQIDPLMEIKTTAPFMSFIRGHNALTNKGIRVKRKTIQEEVRLNTKDKSESPHT